MQPTALPASQFMATEESSSIQVSTTDRDMEEMASEEGSLGQSPQGTCQEEVWLRRKYQDFRGGEV
jgi:hypothetical protein